MDILCGNQKEYTTAINQLYYIVSEIEDELGIEIEGMDDDIASLEALTNDQGESVSSVKEAIEQYKLDLINETKARITAETNIQALLQEQKATIDAAKEELSKLEESYASLIESLTEEEQDSWKDIKEILDSNTDKTPAELLDENVLSQEQYDAITTGNFSEVYSTYVQTVAQRAELNSAVSSLEQLIENNYDSLSDTMKSYVSSLNEKITSLSNVLSDNSASWESVLEAFSNMDDDVTTLISDMSSDIANLKESLGSLEEQLAADISAVNSALETLEKAMYEPQ